MVRCSVATVEVVVKVKLPRYGVHLEVFVSPVHAPVVEPIVARRADVGRALAAYLDMRDVPVVANRHEAHRPAEKVAVLFDRSPWGVGLLTADTPAHLRIFEGTGSGDERLVLLFGPRFCQLRWVHLGDRVPPGILGGVPDQARDLFRIPVCPLDAVDYREPQSVVGRLQLPIPATLLQRHALGPSEGFLPRAQVLHYKGADRLLDGGEVGYETPVPAHGGHARVHVVEAGRGFLVHDRLVAARMRPDAALLVQHTGELHFLGEQDELFGAQPDAVLRHCL